MYPRKREQSGHSSNSGPGERLGENIPGRESEGWTLDLCGERSRGGSGRLRAGGRVGGLCSQTWAWAAGRIRRE